MKYSIVFSSRTGNTAQLASVLKENLPQGDCAYFGPPDSKALEAPVIFMGFWTDKGVCDEDAKSFLQTLKNKTVFLFGTAGFGISQEYFQKVLDATEKNLDPSNKVQSSFMCQGKMPASVLERYQKLLASGAAPANIQTMIDNFHSAASHPDNEDLERMKTWLRRSVRES